MRWAAFGLDPLFLRSREARLDECGRVKVVEWRGSVAALKRDNGSGMWARPRRQKVLDLLHRPGRMEGENLVSMYLSASAASSLFVGGPSRT